MENDLCCYLNDVMEIHYYYKNILQENINLEVNIYIYLQHRDVESKNPKRT